MPLRVRISLLAILAGFWLVLSVASFAHGRVVIGTLYLVCGGVMAGLARQAATRGR